MTIKGLFLAAVLALVGVAAVAEDSEPSGHSEYNGFSIVAAADFPPAARPGDAGPVQTFEIIRPDMRGIALSRLVTTCECVQLEADRAQFGDGERAFLRLRNVKPTAGQNYTFYVQISSPESMVLKYETYVVSDNPPPADEQQ